MDFWGLIFFPFPPSYCLWKNKIYARSWIILLVQEMRDKEAVVAVKVTSNGEDILSTDFKLYGI